MAGIINIVYKKERISGFNGDVGLTLGLGQLTKRKEDLPTSLGSYSLNPKIIPSLNFNYKTPKINAFLQSEVLIQKKLPNNEFTTRHYDDGTTIYSQIPENRKQIQYIVKAGLDWNVDEQNIFTFSSILDYEHHIDTAQIPFINATDMERYRFWAWSESEVTGFLNFRVDYKHQFDLLELLQLQLTYIYYAPKNIPQGKQYARSSLDVGLKKFLFKQKGELQLSFIDILNKFGVKQDVQGEGFTALYENYSETQVVRLGLTYKF